MSSREQEILPHHKPGVARYAVVIVVDHHVSDLALLRAAQLPVTIVPEDANQVGGIDPGSTAGYHHSDTIVRRGDRAEDGIGDNPACQLDRGLEGRWVSFRAQLIGYLPLRARLQQKRIAALE